jgi:MinD superfamily P-loop ATPase
MKLKLTYSHPSAQEPILAEAVLKLGVLINILEANVNAEKGELVVSVDVEGKKLEELIRFFQNREVTVEKVTRMLEIDENKCINCCACVSPCPVKAITIRPDWTIEFDDKKCIGCKICVTCCPVRAIKSLVR